MKMNQAGIFLSAGEQIRIHPCSLFLEVLQDGKKSSTLPHSRCRIHIHGKRREELVVRQTVQSNGP